MLTQRQKFEERIKIREIKTIITEMKNASDYLISRQDMAKKESMSMNIDQQKLLITVLINKGKISLSPIKKKETSQTEMQRGKKWKITSADEHRKIKTFVYH